MDIDIYVYIFKSSHRLCEGNGCSKLHSLQECPEKLRVAIGDGEDAASVLFSEKCNLATPKLILTLH